MSWKSEAGSANVEPVTRLSPPSRSATWTFLSLPMKARREPPPGMGEIASSESGVSTSWYEYVTPTSISVTRTPEAATAHDAPVSVEEPELDPRPEGSPAPPQYTGRETPESAEPLLEPLLPLDAPPELP